MKFIDLNAQQQQLLSNGNILSDEIKFRISKVLDHGQYILGPEVAELENLLSEFTGTKHCIAVSSGTDALLVALMSLGIKKGDEIITTPFSFISTAEVILLLGATPVFVDIDPKTYNIDPEKIEEAITKKTKVILPVSLYGQPANFKYINKIANENKVKVIEDGAQSFGALHHGQRSCNLSDIGTTSFFPSKPLGCYGDGGACFTNDSKLAERIRIISRHGQTKRYFHSELGINGRIDTIQAAILLSKFEIFKQELIDRKEKADIYTKLLNDIGIKSTPYISPENTSVYAQYTINIEHRESIQKELKEMGIPTVVHYPKPLNEQPIILDKLNEININELPLAKHISERVICLPMHPYLTKNVQVQIVNSIDKIINK